MNLHITWPSSAKRVCRHDFGYTGNFAECPNFHLDEAELEAFQEDTLSLPGLEALLKSLLCVIEH